MDPNDECLRTGKIERLKGAGGGGNAQDASRKIRKERLMNLFILYAPFSAMDFTWKEGQR